MKDNTKKNTKERTKEKRTGVGLLIAAVIFAVIVTVVKGYGMDFGGFDVNVEGGDYVGGEFPVWEENPEYIPNEPQWPEEPTREPLPPQYPWPEEPVQEIPPPEYLWPEEPPWEEPPGELPPAEPWQQEDFPREQLLPAAPAPTQIPTPTPIPTPTSTITPTITPTQMPTPTPTRIPTPTPIQTEVSKPAFHLIKRRGEYLEIEVESESRVQILSLRINGKECPWHWERDTILVDTGREDMGCEIEILAFSMDDNG